MFNQILVALDPEDTSVALFEKALTLAQATDADLMLLSILMPDGPNPPAYYDLAYSPVGIDESFWDIYRERYQEYEAKVMARLSNFAEQAMAARVHTEFNQVSGIPGRTICDLARTWKADLVMVGSHGRRGMSEMLLGSVSNYVMHHAPCSVLVVHEHMTTRSADEPANLTTTGR